VSPAAHEEVVYYIWFSSFSRSLIYTILTEVEERQGAEAVRDHRRHVQREHRLPNCT
jgi:hypothetical protein